MNMQDVVDRLKAQCPALDGRVYHAGEITNIETLGQDTPAAIVRRRPPMARGEATGVGQLYRQPLRRRFAVVILAKATMDDAEPMADATDETIGALAGWQPDRRVQVEYDGPGDEVADSGLVTWGLEFGWTDYERTVR